MERKSTSTFFALRNPVFCRLWLASVLSGTFVSAQDMTATWLMHDLGASALALSLMATAASAPGAGIIGRQRGNTVEWLMNITDKMNQPALFLGLILSQRSAATQLLRSCRCRKVRHLLALAIREMGMREQSPDSRQNANSETSKGHYDF
jgi:hypothetical protein